MATPGRPKQFDDDRVTKALRIPPGLDHRLKDAAAERGISVNLVINRAIEDYLNRLLPVDEIMRART
jgi:predicted HicB family RNase H-like nuclease